MLSVLRKPRSWGLTCGAARWLVGVAHAELSSDMAGSRVHSTASAPMGSTGYQAFRDYLKQKPGVESMQRTLGEETLMRLPASQSHEVMRAGNYAYTVDGATSDVYRVPISANDSMQEPELIFCVEDVRPGAQVTGVRRSQCGTQVIIALVAGGESHVYVWEEGMKDAVYQDHVHGAMSIEWGCGRKGTLVYTVADELGRPSRVMMTSLVRDRKEANVANASMLFEDRNPAHFVGLQRAKDWSHLFINAVARTSSEAFIIDETNATTSSVRSRQEGVSYAVEHVGGRLVMLSDQGGENAIYVQQDINRQGGGRAEAEKGGGWRVLYAPQDGDAFIEDMSVNKHAITVLERNTTTGLPVVRVLPLSTSSFADGVRLSSSYLVPIPDFALDCQFGSNEDYASDRIELELRSPIIPTMRVEFDVITRETYMTTHADMDDDSTLIEANLSNYTAMRAPFKSREGHVVPLTLAYRNDAKNPSPAIWIVYGAYGECMDMSYAPHLIPMMNRGYKIIWCHVRGGGELGRSFYHQGRRRHLENSAADLRSCMEYMKQSNVTDKNALFSYSAGAVAACGALDLADAVVLESPFVDLVDAMRDQSHALTVHEHDEFGDPKNEDDLETMKRVCPLTNMRQSSKASRCPPMLICTGEHDTHVNNESIIRFAHSVGGTVWENAYDGHLPETTEELSRVRAGAHAFVLDALGAMPNHDTDPTYP